MDRYLHIGWHISYKIADDSQQRNKADDKQIIKLVCCSSGPAEQEQPGSE